MCFSRTDVDHLLDLGRIGEVASGVAEGRLDALFDVDEDAITLGESDVDAPFVDLGRSRGAALGEALARELVHG